MVKRTQNCGIELQRVSYVGNLSSRKPKLIINVRKNVNFECTSIGLVIDNECFYLGVSPDAKFHCSCCNFGVVKIKCSYFLKDSMLSQAIHDKEKGFYFTYENGLYKW